MHIHDSRSTSRNNNNSNSFRSSSNRDSATNNINNSGNINTIALCNNPSKGSSILNRNRYENDGKSSSVMSNLSSYSLIDDDHIDDQETINVGNLIIDLESDLEKEKIENEQQATSKVSICSTTTNAPSSTFSAKASSSTSNTSTPTSSGKLNQKSSAKHSPANINNNINSSGSNCNNNFTNSSNMVNSCTGNGNNSNSNHHITARSVFKSSADERGELKMRITRETKPGKSEHKIVTSPNQKSPTSSSCNNTAASHANNCEDLCLSESILKPTNSLSISSTKECGTSTSIGTITEPECLGPCEPGTSVTLEGIVWQETEGGILVVNVTWRGKTYVGALLDCTRHDWAPPRLCDSPASDIDSKAPKGVRAKRIVTRSNGIGIDDKNLLQTTGKLRNGKGRRILNSNDLTPCPKRQRESEKSTDSMAAQSEANSSLIGVSSMINSETPSVQMNVDTNSAQEKETISTSNISTDRTGPNSPMLIDCSEPNCSKKYRNMNGLLYHRTYAHGVDNDSNQAQDNNCSSSAKDKIKASVKEDTASDAKDISMELNDDQGHNSDDSKQGGEDVKSSSNMVESKRTPSPQISLKMNSKVNSEPQPSSNNNASAINVSSNTLLNVEVRVPVPRPTDLERRNQPTVTHNVPSIDQNRRTPPASSKIPDFAQASGNHTLSKPANSSTLKQSNPVPLPATTEEGMKPSGTSTGPPPAPHQANCYFNPAFLANTFTPYGLGPYFPRSPLPMYDPLAPPVTSTTNAAFFSRFMNSTLRVPPPPESPSRLLSPSIAKSLPFPPFKVEPGMLPMPNPQMPNPPPLPNMSSLTNPALATGSPLLRMPSQGEHMLPPTSQPPYTLPSGLNPVLGLPGVSNPMGPMGGPQVPSLVDDLTKPFPRRFN